MKDLSKFNLPWEEHWNCDHSVILGLNLIPDDYKREVNQFIAEACNNHETLSQENEYLKQKCDTYEKYWLDLCNKILTEHDKDGWCTVTVSREEAEIMKAKFEMFKLAEEKKEV